MRGIVEVSGDFFDQLRLRDGLGRRLRCSGARPGAVGVFDAERDELVGRLRIEVEGQVNVVARTGVDEGGNSELFPADLNLAEGAHFEVLHALPHLAVDGETVGDGALLERGVGHIVLEEFRHGLFAGVESRNVCLDAGCVRNVAGHLGEATPGQDEQRETDLGQPSGEEAFAAPELSLL